MSDGGGCGQQLVMRREIYFLDHREHSPEYPGVYPHIQAGLLRFIMRNPSARGILANRHGMLPSRLDAWLPPVRGPRGPPAAEPCGSASRRADRPGGRGGVRSVAAAVRQSHGAGRRLSAPLHAQLAEQG
jgi:hypothetical protein